MEVIEKAKDEIKELKQEVVESAANATEKSTLVEKPVEKRLGELEDQDRVERMTKLLTGRLAPSNETAQYLVDRLRQVTAQIEQGTKQLQQHQAIVAQTQTQLERLVGQRDGYARDLEHWDKFAPPPVAE